MLVKVFCTNVFDVFSQTQKTRLASPSRRITLILDLKHENHRYRLGMFRSSFSSPCYPFLQHVIKPTSHLVLRPDHYHRSTTGICPRWRILPTQRPVAWALTGYPLLQHSYGDWNPPAMVQKTKETPCAMRPTESSDDNGTGMG